MVSETLGRVVSGRAAEQLLRDALRDAALTPEHVSASEMQRVLVSTLEHRLTSVIPTLRAHDELRRLATRLQQSYPKATTLFPGAEVAPGNLATLSVWSQDDEPQDTAFQGAVWTAGRQADGAPETARDRSPGSDAGERALGAEDFDAGDFDLDDFEFDDPSEPALLSAPLRLCDLRDASGQDGLLSDLARLGGVHGVVLCNAAGKVVRARSQKGADALGAVMAATAALFRNRPWHILCVDLHTQTVCVRPLGQHFVALLAGGNVNLGQLIAELSSLKESA